MPDADLIKMQQEAAERVRQMQARARQFNDAPAEKREQPRPGEKKQVINKEEKHNNTGGKHSEAHPARRRDGAPAEKRGFSLLAGFGADQDQLLLLLLAVLLASNGASIELVIALMYIAM